MSISALLLYVYLPAIVSENMFYGYLVFAGLFNYMVLIFTIIVKFEMKKKASHNEMIYLDFEKTLKITFFFTFLSFIASDVAGYYNDYFRGHVFLLVFPMVCTIFSGSKLLSRSIDLDLAKANRFRL